MNYGSAQIAVDVIQMLLTLCVAVFVFYSTRGQVKEQRMIDNEKTAEKRFDLQDRRITVVETHLRHMPDSDEIKGIHERIDPLVSELSGLSATVNGFKDTMMGVASQVKSINDYLLAKDK